MKNILIVEPNDFSLRYIVRVIERLGYHSRQARGAAEAGGLLDQLVPDALVCGTNLEDDELFELFDALRRRTRRERPPIIAVTSDQNGAFHTRAAAEEVDEIVPRPLSVRAFFYSLEKCLNRSQRRHIRAPMTIPVTVIQDSGKEHLETHNFGEGGMYIKTPTPPSHGTELDLSFCLLEGTTPFSVRGRVMHTTAAGSGNNGADNTGMPPGMGLMFVHTTETLRAVFTIFMENSLVLKSPVEMGMPVQAAFY